MIVPSDSVLIVPGVRGSSPGPTQIVEPFAALKARLAASGLTADDDGPAGEAWMGHAQFEREWRLRSDGSVRFAAPTDCEGLLRQVDARGQLWMVRCDACGFETGVRLPAERVREHLLERASIPEMFAGRRLDNDDPRQGPTLAACREYVRAFRREPLPAVALWGQAGRGKSHLLALMVETLIRNHGVEAVYRNTAVLLGELRGAIDSGVFERAYSRLLTVPVLALDDLGSTRMTDASREWLGGLIDARYNRERPLLVATNIPPQVWDEQFGERAASRLRGMCLPLRLEGRDRRAQQTLEGMRDVG